MVWQKCGFIDMAGCRQHSSDINAKSGVYPNSSSDINELGEIPNPCLQRKFYVSE